MNTHHSNLRHKRALTTRALTGISLSLALLTIENIHAAEFNFEGSGSQLMEASITRAGSVYYESSVGFNRDSNFNLQKSVQPGWMLNATAIGNLVNVQMSGAGNSVIVNAMQVNQGHQTAIVSLGANVIQSKNSTPETSTTNTNTQTPNAEAVRFTAAGQNGYKN